MGNGFYLSAPPPSPPPSNLPLYFPSSESSLSPSSSENSLHELKRRPNENEGDRILIEVSFGILINVITGLFRVACRSVENPLPTYFLLLVALLSRPLCQNYPRIVPRLSKGIGFLPSFLSFSSSSSSFLLKRRRIINRPRRIDIVYQHKFVDARREA